MFRKPLRGRRTDTRRTCCTKVNSTRRKGKRNVPTPSPLFTSTASEPARSSTFARMRNVPSTRRPRDTNALRKNGRQRTKERLAERVEKQTRVRVLDAIRNKLPDVSSRHDLEMVALDYLHRLGNDNQRRLCRTYGWQKKKTKTAWGARVVDYEKIAGVAVKDMAIADLNRFLVTCALVSDLYCPGYNLSQPLSKDSNLARTALRYKVDGTKLAASSSRGTFAEGRFRKNLKTGKSGDKQKPQTKEETIKARAKFAGCVSKHPRERDKITT